MRNNRKEYNRKRNMSPEKSVKDYINISFVARHDDMFIIWCDTTTITIKKNMLYSLNSILMIILPVI